MGFGGKSCGSGDKKRDQSLITGHYPDRSLRGVARRGARCIALVSLHRAPPRPACLRFARTTPPPGLTRPIPAAGVVIIFVTIR